MGWTETRSKFIFNSIGRLQVQSPGSCFSEKSGSFSAEESLGDNAVLIRSLSTVQDIIVIVATMSSCVLDIDKGAERVSMHDLDKDLISTA